MAEVQQAGQVLEKTTRTRVITEAQPPQSPEFWDYIEKQNLPDAEHIMYLYLNRDNRNVPYGVYTSHFATRDGRLVSIADREAFEQAIQGKFGGGVWRLILKCGRQRKCEAKLFTGDGPTLPPPIDGGETQPMSGNPPHSPFGHLPTHGNPDGAAAIASKAIDTIAGQEHQAVNLGLGMMSTAADVMKRFAERESNPQAPPPGPLADLQNALLQATVARLTADPMQQFMQMLSVFREANGNGNGPAPDMNRQMEQFRSVLAFARELAGGNGGGPPTAGAAIVNTLAGIIPQAVDGIRATAEAWSQGKQAERDAVLLMQGRPAGAPPPGPAPMMHSPFNPPPRPVLPQPAPPAPANGNAANVNVTQLLETKIMELFNAPIPAEEAASRALEFLHTMSGPNPQISYVNLFASGGEDALVNLFNRQPILNPATRDMKRLLEFIRAFLRFHAEDQAEESKEPKPN